MATQVGRHLTPSGGAAVADSAVDSRQPRGVMGLEAVPVGTAVGGERGGGDVGVVFSCGATPGGLRGTRGRERAHSLGRTHTLEHTSARREHGAREVAL